MKRIILSGLVGLTMLLGGCDGDAQQPQRTGWTRDTEGYVIPGQVLEKVVKETEIAPLIFTVKRGKKYDVADSEEFYASITYLGMQPEQKTFDLLYKTHFSGYESGYGYAAAMHFGVNEKEIDVDRCTLKVLELTPQYIKLEAMRCK